ncbi:MAG TPA: hypothetical protein VEY51_11090, partial [Chondromyces sp.]|nr:hypothetical protein [Chondromyces sp.]
MFSGSKLSLQIKVLTLIISLIMFIIVLLNGVYALLELKQTEQQKGQLALQTAKAVSFMPDVQGAFLSKPLETDIQPIVEQMRQQAGAAAIIVENREGKVLAASDPELIGQRGEEQENFKALVYAGYYLFENDLFLKGKAP